MTETVKSFTQVEVVQNNGKGKTKKRAARANLFFAN